MPKSKFDIVLDEKKFIRQVEDDIESDRTATSTYRDNREYWLKLGLNYAENLNAETDTSDTKEEFDVSLPLISIGVEQTHPRYLAAVRQSKPFFRIYPTSQGDIQKTAINQKYGNWALMNNTPNFLHIFDENALITIIEGFCPLYQTWSKEYRKTKTRHFFPVIYNIQGPMGEPMPVQMDIETIAKELFEVEGSRKLENVEEVSADNGEYKISYIEKEDINVWSDRTAYIRVQMDENEQNPDKGRIMAEVVSSEIMFEGVRMHNLDYDCLYHPKDIDSLQPPDNPHLIVQCERSLSDIIMKWNKGKGLYNNLTNKDISKIKKALIDAKGNKPDGSRTNATEAIEDVLGTDEQKTPNDMVRFYECYYSKDIDDDGIDEEIIVTVFPDAEKIGRVKFLEEVFRHAKRPVDLTVFDIIPHSVLGRGLPEKLKSIQEVYDDVWNQILNYGAVITLPFFFYLAGGNMNNDVYQLRPGEGYPLSSLDDIRFPQFQNNLPIDFAMMQQIYGHFERYAKVNDPMMGKQGGARQTATATLKLLSESMEGMSVNFERYKQAWSKILLNFWQLHRAYMPERVKFRVWNQMANDGNGDWEFEEISRMDMIEHPDINIDITIENTSSLFQRELYEHLFQLFVNPVSIQAGIIQPHNIYHLHELVCDAYQIQDKFNLISKPTVQPPPRPPEVENDMMSAGRYVPPQSNENFQMHYASHFQTLYNFGKFMSPQAKQVFQRHMQETQELANYQTEMLQMAQQAASLPQQAMLPGGSQSGGTFQASPDLGRSPMQSVGNALAAGRQNPQGIQTNVMPMQG